MTHIEAAKWVLDNGCALIRPRTGEKHQFDVKPFTSRSKRGWFYMDAFTASAMVAVFNALNAQNQAKFHIVPLPKVLDFVWKNVA